MKESDEAYITVKSRNPACGIVGAELEHRGITQAKACLELGVTKGYLSQIVNYRRDISYDFALKIEAYLGVEAKYLLKIQTSWKLKRAKKEKANELQKITKYQAA